MATILNTFWIVEGLDGGMSGEGILTQSETAIIEFDSVVENIPDAIESSGFRGGQEHRSFSAFSITGDIGATVQPESNGTTWQFDIEYTTEGWSVNTSEQVDYKPKVGYSKWTYSRTLYNDKETGEAILLPNGLPYDPPLMESISSMIIHVTVRENSANGNRIALCGSVNNTAIRIAGTQIPKFCGMFDDYKTEPFTDELGFVTFNNTYSIKTKFVTSNAGEEIGFKVETLAASFSQKVDGVLEAITEKLITTPESAGPPAVEEVSELVQVSEPVMIDEDGAVTTTPHYQLRVPFDLISFSQFGLPSSYPAN
ncbi:MAG: hypothetical protein V3U78_09975 [Thiotrichaceae bacterium]